MLRIYGDMLWWIEQLAPLVERIKRHNRDLAKQLERSSCSVVLNTAEGSYARGGHRTAAYAVALKEARESYAALTLVRLALPRRP